jgi:hypothetical protein
MTSQASASLSLHDGENDATLTLGTPTSSSDGGMPDIIYLSDHYYPVPDLTGVDLAGLDLSVAPDLSVPPDLSGTPPDLTSSPPDLSALHCPPDKIFCDDFETGDVSRWSSNGVTNGVGSFSVDNTHALGNFAFDGKTIVSASSAHAEVEQAVSLAAPSTLSARYYVYLESNPGGYALFWSEFNGNAGYSVGIDSSGNWVITQDMATNPDLHSTTAVTFNTWHCVEMQVDYPAGQIQLFVDGTQVIGTTPTAYTVPNQLLGGLTRAPGSVAAEVWFDDVAFAPHYIGCE